MELLKPLTMKEFLSFEKIIWNQVDHYDFTHYTTTIYPNEDYSDVETYIKRPSWYKGDEPKSESKSEEIRSDGILEQINEAIERNKGKFTDERITGTKKTTLKGHYTGKPTKKCETAYKKMIGEIPNFKKNFKKITF